MTTHQQKKLDDAALLAFRDRFALPLSDERRARSCAFYKPADDSAEMQLPARAPRRRSAATCRRGARDCAARCRCRRSTRTRSSRCTPTARR